MNLKNFAFGLGVGIGFGLIVQRLYKERQIKRDNLISCLKQLSSEVRQLRETFKNYATSTDAPELSSDDEFFDTEKDLEQTSTELIVFLKHIDMLQEGSSADRQDAYNMLINKTNEIPNNVELLWRYSKGQYQVSCLKEKAGDIESEKIMLEKGIETAKLALKCDERNYKAHQWYAILVGSKIKYMDNKEKILAGHDYQQHIERAISLNANDAMLYFLLGRYLFEVYMLPWYLRKIAAALFAEPPSAKIENALEMFLKAESLHPGFWTENLLFIGKCYYQMSNYKVAKEWFEKTVNAVGQTNEDRKTRQDALDLLKKCE